MQVHVVDLEPLRLVAMPHRGAYAKIGETFGKLHNWLERNGLEDAPKIAIYYDDPYNTPEDQLRSEACAILRPDDQVSGEDVKETTIPAGRYAMTSFAGPYSALGGAWYRFYTELIPKAGLSTTEDLCFERYVQMPHKGSPDDPITELYAPIR